MCAYVMMSSSEMRSRLTSGVCRVSVLSQRVLVSGIGADGRAGVRVLVDQTLNTFPAANVEEKNPTIYLCVFLTTNIYMYIGTQQTCLGK